MFSVKTSLFVIFSAFCLCAAALAQTPTPAQSLTDNPVYQRACANCHGKKAEGHRFGGPPLATGNSATASAEELSKIINDGKHRMPKFSNKLTSDEIDTLVQQLKSNKQK